MDQRVLGISVADRLSLVSIIRLGLGGAVGGLMTFLVMDPTLSGKALLSQSASGDGWVAMGTSLGAVIGLTIGACLIAAEEWQTRSVVRILGRSLLGAVAGCLCGALGGLDGQFAFSLLRPISIVGARCVGWALMGAGAGICPGLVGRSSKRAELGAFGGLFGGAAGGLLFDALAWAKGSADLSRAFGLLVVGATIGIAVGFLEEIAKEYWVTVLTGSKEGRSYVLSKEETSVGRSETCDISLFGDASVAKYHARFVKSEQGVSVIAEEPGLALLVNSAPVGTTSLCEGDTIVIGTHRLRFNERGGRVRRPVEPMSVEEVEQPRVPMLRVTVGPHAGAEFPLTSASISIGRSVECEVPLPEDEKISRKHALLTWDGSSWKIEDCGSKNGLYVNDQPVGNQVLQAGDRIRLGESTLLIR